MNCLYVNFSRYKTRPYSKVSNKSQAITIFKEWWLKKTICETSTKLEIDFFWSDVSVLFEFSITFPRYYFLLDAMRFSDATIHNISLLFEYVINRKPLKGRCGST